MCVWNPLAKKVCLESLSGYEATELYYFYCSSFFCFGLLRPLTATDESFKALMSSCQLFATTRFMLLLLVLLLLYLLPLVYYFLVFVDQQGQQLCVLNNVLMNNPL